LLHLLSSYSKNSPEDTCVLFTTSTLQREKIESLKDYPLRLVTGAGLTAAWDSQLIAELVHLVSEDGGCWMCDM
jgi:hypothetical protein